MKVLFINPNHNWNEEAQAYGSKSFLLVRKITPPLGLGYLAALIRKEHIVKIIDANALDLSYNDIIEITKNFNPDITAVTSMYPSTKHTIRMAKLIKKYAGILIVGGADPTVRAEKYLEEFDIVNRGQGEISFLQFINGENKKNIKGFVYRENGMIIDNGHGQMVENLDTLSFDFWDLLPLEKYRPAVMQIKYAYPSAVIMTSRGCPHHCAYCAIHTVVPKLKFRSIDNVFEEIKFLTKNYGVKHIEFFDDTFTFKEERIIELCELIIKEKIKIKWSCVTRPDAVNPKMLKLMKKAGCYFTLFGVQSVDKEVLKKINRTLYKDKVANAIAMTKKAGIMVRLDFILGLPGSTIKSMFKSFEFVKETSPDIVDFYPVLWLPETTLTKKFKPEYEDEYLDKIASVFYKLFYFRINFIINVLKNCVKPVYIYRYFICFYALFYSIITKKFARFLNLNEKY